jgi:AAA+ superfamily predicted ATPase
MNGFDSISISDDNVDMVVDRDIASLHTPEENISVPRDRVRTSRNHLEQTRFADIIGHANAKLHMEELLLPLALPPEVAASIFTGARAMPASVLLYGPPGCGKVRSVI